MKKTIKKTIISYIVYGIIIAIFIFLLQTVYSNWQVIQTYDYDFNPFYLVLSLILVIGNVVALSYMWGRIFFRLEPHAKLNNWRC